MKIKYYEQEWYPIFCLDDRAAREAEVSKDLVNRYKKAYEEFDKVRDEFNQVIEGQQEL